MFYLEEAINLFIDQSEQQNCSSMLELYFFVTSNVIGMLMTACACSPMILPCGIVLVLRLYESDRLIVEYESNSSSTKFFPDKKSCQHRWVRCVSRQSRGAAQD